MGIGEKIPIAQLDLKIEDLIKKASDAKAALKSIKDQQKELIKSGQETSAQFVRNDADVKRLSATYRTNINAIQAQVSEGGRLQNQTDAIKVAVDRLNQTEREARDNNKILIGLRKEVNTTTAEGTAQVALINAKLDENNKFIKANVSGYEKQKIGIGDYKQQIIEAYQEIEKEKAALQDLNKELIKHRDATNKNSEEYKIFNQQINNNLTQINVYSDRMAKAKGETTGFSSALELAQGGLSGFLEKAKAAGGAGPLLASVFSGIRAGLTSITKAALAFIATPIGAAIAGLAVIAGATKKWVDYNKEAAKANQETQAITKLTGDQLNKARVAASKLADVFDVDFKDVLSAAQSYVNEYGGTFENALSKIQDGLTKSIGNNDKYLDSVKEYPRVIGEAGFSIEEFQSLINTGIDTQLYEKLPEAVKEFSQAVKEQTPAARDALTNAFGEKFTSQLFGNIKQGSITAKDALILVANEAKRLNINVQQNQQLTADLFKGAGEDAGGAQKIFDAVTKSIENQKKPLTELEKATKDYTDAEIAAGEAQDRLLKSDGYQIWETNVKGSLSRIKQGFYDLIFIIANGREELDKIYKQEATDKGLEQSADNATKSFEVYISRRKKSLGEQYTFERVQEDYLQTYKNELAIATDKQQIDIINAKIKAIENYRDKSISVDQNLVDGNLISLQKQKASLEAAGKDTYKIEEQILLKRLSLYDKSTAEYAAAENELIALRTKKGAEYLAIYSEQLKLNLQLYQQSQGEKFKSLDQEIKLAEQVYNREVEIAKAEYNASKKTANDKLKLQVALNEALKKQLDAQSEAVIANADNELANFISNNKTKLDNNKFLSDELYKQEVARMEAVTAAEKDNLQVQLDNKKISQDEYNRAIKDLDDKAYQDRQAIDQQRYEADQAKQIADIENKKTLEGEQFQYDLATQLEEFDLKAAAERKAAEKSGADLVALDAAIAQQRENIEKEVANNKLALYSNTLTSVSNILGQQSAAGKAFAAAGAVIDTYVAANKALASAPPPFNYILAAGVVATGLGNVKKIASTKTPKFAKGALVEIGGNRHSNGGTTFEGSDGTRFEAEQGELIGVMNRNAAMAFMGFNNLFKGGSGVPAQNYFASGGIVDRNVNNIPGIDYKLLAGMIAEANRELPAPVVSVTDIATVSNKMIQVQQSANF